ncbi:MAG: hypothetical protein JW748_04740 [Anaerolineales bacterium]|nr:hypothetical protein [Anaerolineales bacterium]
MNWTRFFPQSRRILFSAVCLILSGCGSFFPDASTSPIGPSSQIVHYGTVASFDCDGEIIFIASSGYGYYTFIDMFGKKRSETTSSLWITIGDHPEKSRVYRGYAGLVIHYYNYKIEVLRLGRDLQNQFTEVNMGYMRERETPASFEYCPFY